MERGLQEVGRRASQLARSLDYILCELGRLESFKVGEERHDRFCAEKDPSGCCRGRGQTHEENISVAKAGGDAV